MPSEPETKPAKRWANCAKTGFWVLSIFLIGLAAKFQLIHKFSSPFPYLDQWPGEAIELFIPWYTHQFTPATLLQAHNEHRIFFTRLTELWLLMANGKWDGRLEMILNAIVHAAAIAGFGWLLVSLLGQRARLLVWTLLVLYMTLPFAWENTLWGFQSQFYYLQIFSILAIWLLGLSEPLSRRWWLGVACAILGLFTMASGFLAAVAVVALVLVNIFKNRENWRRTLPTLAVCIALTIAGLFLKPAAIDHSWRARSAMDFFTSLGKDLAWPWATKPFYAPFNLLPIGLLAWMYLRFGEANSKKEAMVLGIGIWVVLQSLALAYSRGVGGVAPAWRHMDVLSFMTIASCLSIWLLATRYRERLKFRPVWYGVFVIWAFGCLGGLFYLSNKALNTYIPGFVLEQKNQFANACAFLNTGDAAAMAKLPPTQMIVENADAAIWLLRNPVVRQILPPCPDDPPGTMDPVSPSRNPWLAGCASKMTAGWLVFLVAGFAALAVALLIKASPPACAVTSNTPQSTTTTT